MIFMSYLFDIVLILILLGFMYLGHKKGLILTVVNFISYLVSIVLSFFIYKPIKGIIIKLPFIQNVNDITSRKVSGFLGAKTEGLPSFLKEFFDKEVNMLSASVSETLTNAFVFILCVILVILLVKLFLKVTAFTAKGIKNLPIIRNIDNLLGLIFGLLNGLLIVYIILTAGMLFLTGESYKLFTNGVNGSYITKYFYDNNILMNLIIKYL